MKRLKSIEYQFPHHEPAGLNLVGFLSSLLESAPSVQQHSESLLISPHDPPDSLPLTEFRCSNLNRPCLILHTSVHFELELGCLSLRSSSAPPLTSSSCESRNAQLDSPPVDAATLLGLFEGHVLSIDHTGVNVPSAIVDRTCFDSFRDKLAQTSALYDYPTGDPWYFVLPTTSAELCGQIKEFPSGRNPKFELVWETSKEFPVLQFDLETDLSRPELEELLPAPYGIAAAGVSQYFRSVYLKHHWPGLGIRFDFRYRVQDPQNDWTTGKMLVAEGRRH